MNEFNGKVYGVPIQESSAGFYYNKSVFAAAGIDVSGYTVENPWTFAEFKSVCQRLVGHVDIPVDMRLDATRDETATYLLYPFIYAAGGSFVNPSDGKQVQGYLNSAKSIKGFQFLKDLYSSSYTSFTTPSTGFFANPPTVGMYLSSGWTIPTLDLEYKRDRATWGLLPYPKDEARASATGSWSYGLTKDTEAGRLLLKWLASEESAQVVTDATGMIPAYKSLGNDYSEGTPEYVLRKQLEICGTPRPETVGYNEFSSAFRAIIAGLKNTNDVSGLVNSVTTDLQRELNEK